MTTQVTSPEGSDDPGISSGGPNTSGHRRIGPPSFLILALGSIGVVYGDIGTSPLSAFKESLTGEHGAGVTTDAIFGVLSMIFWAVTLIVSIKYMLLVLRADNDGEGGILALLGLVFAVRHRQSFMLAAAATISTLALILADCAPLVLDPGLPRHAPE